MFSRGVLSFSGVGKRYRMRSARQSFLKPCPLISEKLVFGCALFSNVKSDIAAGDHDWDNPTGKVQRQGLGEDKEYMAHKMASTCTYLRAYINTLSSLRYRRWQEI